MAVTEADWRIEDYFPGPDARYSGDFVRIKGESVLDYIQAFEQNFTDYTALKSAIPEGGNLASLA